jgi:NDP-sugar pyrophosphorylase family protein
MLGLQSLTAQKYPKVMSRNPLETAGAPAPGLLYRPQDSKCKQHKERLKRKKRDSDKVNGFLAGCNSSWFPRQPLGRGSRLGQAVVRSAADRFRPGSACGTRSGPQLLNWQWLMEEGNPLVVQHGSMDRYGQVRSYTLKRNRNPKCPEHHSSGWFAH